MVSRALLLCFLFCPAFSVLAAEEKPVLKDGVGQLTQPIGAAAVDRPGRMAVAPVLVERIWQAGCLAPAGFCVGRSAGAHRAGTGRGDTTPAGRRSGQCAHIACF